LAGAEFTLLSRLCAASRARDSMDLLKSNFVAHTAMMLQSGKRKMFKMAHFQKFKGTPGMFVRHNPLSVDNNMEDYELVLLHDGRARFQIANRTEWKRNVPFHLGPKYLKLCVKKSHGRPAIRTELLLLAFRLLKEILDAIEK
jgi:hypothetical protein